MWDLKGRSTEELTILGMSLVCLCGQVPYGIYRLSAGDWLIGSVDLFGAGLCFGAIYYVLRYRSVGFIGVFMSIAAMLGVLFIVRNGGAEDIQFVYPVIVLSYFLLRPLIALALSAASIVAVAIILLDHIDPFFMSKILLSMLGCSLFAYIFASIRNRQSEQLTLLSTRDPLTGVMNRRSLDERLEQFVLQQKRQEQPAVLIILDLDNFKAVNDRYGHATGDKVLKRVAETIAQRTRATDQLFRYGGDEFVVLLTDVTLEQSVGLAEDLRARVEATEAMEGSGISISLGVSSYETGKSASDWLGGADDGLLKAKSAGRNQVIADAEISHAHAG